MHFFVNAYRIINKYNQKTKNARCYGTEDLLYPAEVHMIEVIGAYERITTTKLAEVLGVTKGAVSQVTRKLIEKNMIEKASSKGKNNEVLISLTEKGRAVFFYHRNIHEKMLKKIDMILCDLPEESKLAMNRIIYVLEDALDKM